MKLAKKKILFASLAATGVVAAIIPTVVLSSCSTTANPYLTAITANNSTLDGHTFNFEYNFSNKTASYMLTTGGEKVTPTSVQDEWKKLKEKYSDLPDINKIDDKNFVNKPFASDAKKVIDKSNILVIFNSVINNFKSIFENFLSVILTKYPANEVQKALGFDQKDSPPNIFKDYFISGRNVNEFYARLWLSDIKVNITMGSSPAIGTVTNKTTVDATISEVKLNFHWFQAQDNGSAKLDEKKIKELGIKANSFTIDATQLISGFSFQLGINRFEENDTKKTIFNGLISGNTSQPIKFNFTSPDDAENKKSNYINTKVIQLKNEKIYDTGTTYQTNLKQFVKEIGYLDKQASWDGKIPSNLTDANYQDGINWLKKCFDASKITKQ